MSSIVSFVPRQQKRDEQTAGPAVIIIFPGVRYERRSEDGDMTASLPGSSLEETQLRSNP